MNFFRTNDVVLERERIDPPEAEGRTALSARQRARIERDQERGYSINVKQIVLAFGVEFVIIGLILTNNFAAVAELPGATTLKTVRALLFPIAMAMVELARVPLAIAVRTQNSWHVKLAALVGVCCAVSVTATSLIQIGNSTFNPRLEETHNSDAKLADLRSQRDNITKQIATADELVRQRQSEKDRAFQANQALAVQLNAQKPQECTTTTVPSAIPGGPPEMRQRCQANPALRPLTAAIGESKAKLLEAEAAVREAEAQRQSSRYDTSKLDAEIRAAEQENRGSIYQSQLHAYAAMLLGKDPQNVTDGDVKLLEWYLIVVPSIAAAFSSTLIAMTAVRRIKPKKSPADINFPDEAAAYLFGPLVTAIRKEAHDAVTVAIQQGHSKEKSA